MAELRRLELDSPDTDAARDRQVESLLVEGLERYFSARYDEAIHLWTRVLFLDRSHPRARAYIDRARTALAERQRRSDELLDTSQRLLDRGRTVEARQVLGQAIAWTGDDERASALRAKLERVERAHAAQPGARLPIGAAAETPPAWVWSRRSPAVSVLAATVAAVVLLVVGITSPAVRQWMGFGSTTEPVVTADAPPALPVLSTLDVAITRARSLYAAGHLTDALQILDRVSDTDAPPAAAEALRAQIERSLLSSGRAATAMSNLESTR